MNSRSLKLFAVFILLSTFIFGQDKKEREKRRQICLFAVEDDIADLNPKLNKKVNQLLKKKFDNYYGYHAVHNQVKYITTSLGVILAKTRQVDYITFSEKKGCQLEAIMLIQDHMGGGSYSEMRIDGYYGSEALSAMVFADNPYGMVAYLFGKQTCTCVEKNTNWNNAPGGGGDGTYSNDGSGISVAKPEIFPDGPYTKKNDAGAVIRSGEYKNNKPVGHWKWFDESGSIYKEKEYGVDGSCKSTDYSGGNKSFMVNTNAAGERNGLMISYDKNGNVEEEKTYINGKENGPRKTYNNSKLVTSGQILDGQKDGAWKYYDTKGDIEAERTFSKGTENGPCKLYLKGKLSSAGQFKDGKRDGAWKIYDVETGKLKRTDNYKDGEPQQ